MEKEREREEDKEEEEEHARARSPLMYILLPYCSSLFSSETTGVLITTLVCVSNNFRGIFFETNFTTKNFCEERLPNHDYYEYYFLFILVLRRAR